MKLFLSRLPEELVHKEIRSSRFGRSSWISLGVLWWSKCFQLVRIFSTLPSRPIFEFRRGVSCGSIFGKNVYRSVLPKYPAERSSRGYVAGAHWLESHARIRIASRGSGDFRCRRQSLADNNTLSTITFRNIFLRNALIITPGDCRFDPCPLDSASFGGGRDIC